MSTLVRPKEQARPAVLVQCSWLGMLTSVLEATWGCQASGEGLYTGQYKPLLQVSIEAWDAILATSCKLGSQGTACQGTASQTNSHVHCQTLHLAWPHVLDTT